MREADCRKLTSMELESRGGIGGVVFIFLLLRMGEMGRKLVEYEKFEKVVRCKIRST